MKRFPKKRIAITGAGSGFGRALALEFARHGWNVASNDINLTKAEETLDLVKQAGGDGLALTCDVTKIDNIENMAAHLEKEWNGIDIVINNAGVAAGGFMEDHSLDDWEWVLRINLMGMVYGCKVFIPFLEKQGQGHIVNVASAAGLLSAAEMAIYNVSKGAVVSLSETLRTELSPRGIGVTVVCPGFFKTDLLSNLRSTHDRADELANLAMDNSTTSAEDVAKKTYKDVKKNRMYSIAMRDMKILWGMKRFFPETYFKLMSKLYQAGRIDKRFELDEKYSLANYKKIQSR